MQTEALLSNCDGQLLSQFVDSGREEPFEALVLRHQALVLGVCQRVLGPNQDAEDAAQAAFVTLALKARSLTGRASIAGWLHHVAWHLAQRVRQARYRQRRHEHEAGEMLKRETALSAQSVTPDELLLLKTELDEALDGLPEKYRLPIMLHHIEGYTKEQTAALLSTSSGTVSTWLERGREQLRQRLARRGLTLSASVLATSLTSQLFAASATTSFAASTAKAATLVAFGNAAAAGAVSAHVAALSQGMLKAMLIAKVKVAALVTATLILLAGGALGLKQATAEDAATSPQAEQPPIVVPVQAEVPQPAAVAAQVALEPLTIHAAGILKLRDNQPGVMVTRIFPDSFPRDDVLEKKLNAPADVAFSTAQVLYLVSSGPVLDGPDFAIVKSFTRKGNALELTVAHTSARQSGMQLRRNYIWQPVLHAPFRLPAGEYKLSVNWLALEQIPDGKPHPKQPEQQTIEFTVAQAKPALSAPVLADEAEFQMTTAPVWFTPERSKQMEIPITLRITNKAERDRTFAMTSALSPVLTDAGNRALQSQHGQDRTVAHQDVKLAKGQTLELKGKGILQWKKDGLSLGYISHDDPGAFWSFDQLAVGDVQLSLQYTVNADRANPAYWQGQVQSKPVAVTIRIPADIVSPLWPVDETRLGKAPIVLRVRKIKSKGGDKYGWDEVRVLSVFKNITSHKIDPSDESEGLKMDVAHFSAHKGVPEGESTLYLEPYNQGKPDYWWKLLGDGAEEGVSHNDPKPAARPKQPNAPNDF